MQFFTEIHGGQGRIHGVTPDVSHPPIVRSVLRSRGNWNGVLEGISQLVDPGGVGGISHPWA